MNDLLNYGYLSPPRHRATPSHFRLIHIPPNHAHRSLLAEQASDPLPVGEAPPHTSDRWTVCQIMVYLYAIQCRGAYSSPTLPQLRIYPNARCTQRDRSRGPFSLHSHAFLMLSCPFHVAVNTFSRPIFTSAFGVSGYRHTLKTLFKMR